MKRTLWLLAALLGLASAAAQGQAPRSLSVTGSGTVYGQPDQAVLDLGVNLADADLSAALESANTAINEVIEALTAAGVAQEDIRTSYFNIWQEQPYGPDGMPGTPLYRVNNMLSVTVRDTAKVSEVLDGAIRAGANAVNGVQYTLADPEALAQEAREKAFENARAKAEQLAELAGLELGEVLMLSDGSNFVPVVPGDPRPMAMMEGAGGAGIPVTGGQLAVTASVTVQFALR